jgi:hypothetical protein
VTHYEVLGVAADATASQIRRAYLGLARQFHPDYHTDSEASARAAEERMLQINLAWQVLNNDEGRAAYDRSLGLRDDVGPVSSGPIIRQPSTAFRPYVPDDEDDDDSWRYEPDEVDPLTVPPKIFIIGAPGLAALGISIAALGIPLEKRELIVVGIICLMFSLLLFVLAPMLAMTRGMDAEERARTRR